MTATATSKNLLVELFVEELPPKALEKLGRAFADGIVRGLREQGLCSDDARPTPFATPRRLAVHIENVLAQAADKQVEIKLVPVAIGLDDDGRPTKVLAKKLAAIGADVSVVPQLRQASDGKKDTLWLDRTEPGVDLVAGLQKALDDAVAKLPIPKVMTYQQQDGWTDVKFVRPAHRLIALHGSEVVPVTTLGLTAGRETQGHRFEAGNVVIEVRDADSYAAQLDNDGRVLASFAARRDAIRAQLDERAQDLNLTPIPDDDLLDEVTALVELPNVLACGFEDEFLSVPQECLILTMKQNQKYFPLLDSAGKLTNRFLIVSNIAPKDPGAVIEGNERVVRPRLADAKFFFDQDRKNTLESRLPRLAKVVYHNKLGSQLERVERVRAIARAIGKRLGDDRSGSGGSGSGEAGGAELAAQADRAAQLGKGDLLTEMVGEFPELQGIMGGYYALNDGEPEAIAHAIEDHYKPRFAGDELPRNDVGLVVALADKLETLVGMFGIGQKPTGDKDPFALRRHALGVIRMLIGSESPLELEELIGFAVPAFASSGDHAIEDPTAALSDFVFDRLQNALRDDGYTAQEVAAVVSLRPQQLADVPRRLAAVRAFAALPEAEALAAANKRIGNILKKGTVDPGVAVQESLLREDAERRLWQALTETDRAAQEQLAAGDYTAALSRCAALREPVDAFFEAVMVNADDDGLRRNRLALLARLQRLMNGIADLAQLA